IDYVACARDAGKWRGRAAFVSLDAASPPADVFEKLGCPDVLIHLAWGGLPNYRSRHHFESELPHQYSLLRRLVDGGLRKLVVVGTCFEYGMRYGPLSEGMDPAPANPYGLAKDTLRSQLQYLAEASSVQ